MQALDAPKVVLAAVPHQLDRYIERVKGAISKWLVLKALGAGIFRTYSSLARTIV